MYCNVQIVNETRLYFQTSITQLFSPKFLWNFNLSRYIFYTKIFICVRTKLSTLCISQKSRPFAFSHQSSSLLIWNTDLHARTNIFSYILSCWASQVTSSPTTSLHLSLSLIPIKAHREACKGSLRSGHEKCCLLSSISSRKLNALVTDFCSFWQKWRKIKRTRYWTSPRKMTNRRIRTEVRFVVKNTCQCFEVFWRG